MTSCETAEPLLLHRSDHDGGRSSRMLARRAQRGELVRLAPGTYASTRRWLLLPRHERRRMVAVAFSDSRRRPVTFCGATALELLGYPVVEPVPRLHVRAAHRGDSGTTQQPSPYVNDQAALRAAAELSAQGLMNGDGRVPMLPLVRWHWNLPGAGPGEGPAVTGTAGAARTGTAGAGSTGPAGTGSTDTDGMAGAGPTDTAGTALTDTVGAGVTGAGLTGTAGTASDVLQSGCDGFPPEGPVEVSVRMDDGTVLGRVRVDALPVAMAAVFGTEPLSTGMPTADAIQRHHPAAATAADRARELLRTAAQRTRFDAQWGFADAWAESAGESLSRAIIHEEGFVVPEVQYEVRSGTGELVARTDFYWEAICLVGEFDGLVKYTGRLARPGVTGPVGQDALVREKRREDALRRLEYGVARWTWAELFNRPRLVGMLEQHGVPRRQRQR